MNKQILTELCTLDGVSGREGAVRSYILDKLNASIVPMDVNVDSMGNILVHLHGKSEALTTVLFDAHMDEVGFMITGINGDGTLSFSTVGSIDKQALFGQRVRIGSTLGVIGGKAVHHCSAQEKGSIPDVSALSIDIGVNSYEEAQSIVKIGECGTFAADLNEWTTDFLVGKALDDRVGCALLLSLAEKQPERDIWLSFSVQEEVGLRGAKVVAEAICPQIAVAIDATTAADIAGSTDKTCVCRVGHGPVVSFADKATLYDTDLYEEIRALARQNDIETQTKTTIAGGNNAASLQRGNTGARTAAISLPCRYIHTSSCAANYRDVLAMESLLFLLAERLTV